MRPDRAGAIVLTDPSEKIDDRRLHTASMLVEIDGHDRNPACVLVIGLVGLGAGLHRAGFVRVRVRWVRALDSHKCDCGVEFLEESKGLMEPDES